MTDRVLILAYHGVTAEPLPVFNWCQIDVERFRSQMAMLADEFEVVPLRDAIERLARGERFSRRTAVITFDDGFRSVHTLAFPILAEFNLPATVFLVTGVVDTRQPPWPELVYNAIVHSRRAHVALGGRAWPLNTSSARCRAFRQAVTRLKRLDQPSRAAEVEALLYKHGSPPIAPESPLATLSWAEIHALQDSGLFDFGSHTHTHPILALCDEQQQCRELSLSRDILAERLGTADTFAYPNGTRADYTSFTKAAVEQLGYRCALTAIDGFNSSSSDRFALRRVSIGAHTTFEEFNALLTAQTV